MESIKTKLENAASKYASTVKPASTIGAKIGGVLGYVAPFYVGYAFLPQITDFIIRIGNKINYDFNNRAADPEALVRDVIIAGAVYVALGKYNFRELLKDSERFGKDVGSNLGGLTGIVTGMVAEKLSKKDSKSEDKQGKQ